MVKPRENRQNITTKSTDTYSVRKLDILVVVFPSIKWCTDLSINSKSIQSVTPRTKLHSVNMNRLIHTVRSKLGQHPTLKNCVYYGSLFCGAEVSQQLYIRKYLPRKQVRQDRKNWLKLCVHWCLGTIFSTFWHSQVAACLCVGVRDGSKLHGIVVQLARHSICGNNHQVFTR